MLTRHHQLMMFIITMLIVLLALAVALMPGSAHGFIF
jgi:hypothetical protein